jgi:hypothetical protein
MSTESPGRPSLEERIVRPNQLIPWMSVVGVLATGVIGLIGGLMALGEASRQNPIPFVGAGACLLASAVGFGLLSNAIFRR